MSVRDISRVWNQFFFAPQKPTPVALYRILLALLVVANLGLLYPDWLTWYGSPGVMSLKTMHAMEPGVRINLFAILPPGNFPVLVFYWIFLLFAVFLLLGFLTRISSIAVFIGLASIHERNILILNAGDTLMRVTAFFLMFAPGGAAFSIDRLWRIYRGKEGLEIPLRLPWAQRMIQIQGAFLYSATFYWKTLGITWLNGTALYYVLHLTEFRRFPMPGMDNPVLVMLLTWATLAVEFSLGVLVWVREFRYWILLAGVCLHLSIEYTMNVPLFQWTMMATYVTFIYPADLSRAWNWIRSRVPRPAARIPVVYDGACLSCARLADVVRAIDVLDRLAVFDYRSPDVRGLLGGLAPATVRTRLLVRGAEGWRGGLAAAVALSRAVPLVWLLAPLRLLGSYSRGDLKVADASKAQAGPR